MNIKVRDICHNRIDKLTAINIQSEVELILIDPIDFYSECWKMLENYFMRDRAYDEY